MASLQESTLGAFLFLSTQSLRHPPLLAQILPELFIQPAYMMQMTATRRKPSTAATAGRVSLLGVMVSSPYLPSMPISKVISWISCSDFPLSQIAKEFVGWMKSGPKDIGTATFETLRICEKSMNYWDGGFILLEATTRTRR